MTNKINWTDNLKAFGILAVVLGHMTSPFGQFIFSWHMPLFFIVAGFFIKFDMSLKGYVVKDFKRLMLPYFLFSVMALVAEILKRIVLYREALNYLEEFQGIFIWMDMASLINTYAFVLWFLPALFFSRVTLVVINKYIRNIFIQFLFVIVINAL